MNTRRVLGFLARVFRPHSELALDFTWEQLLRNVDTTVKNRTYDHVESELDKAMNWLEETRQHHPNYTEKLCRLAGLYQSLAGDNSATEEILRKAVGAAEDNESPTSLKLAVPLNSLGLLLLQQRRYQEAELLFQRLLTIVESTLGREHIEVATALENLAAVQRQTGRTDEASRTRARAVQIRNEAGKRNSNQGTAHDTQTA